MSRFEGGAWTDVSEVPVTGARSLHRDSAVGVERAVVFLLAASIPAYLALRGGAYDLVIRQAAGIVLWWGLALCLAFGVLPRARPDRVARLPLLALAGLVAWTGLSLLWTESDERTFAELARVLDYGGIALVAYLGLHTGTWRAAAAGLVTAALGISSVAVAGRLVPAAFPPDEVALAFGGERLSYPLDYWNAVGYWSAMAIAAAVAWSAHWRRSWGRGFALGAAPVAGLALFLTYSRGSMLAAVLALLAVVALSRSRTTAGLHVVSVAVATALAAAVAETQPEIANGTGGEGGALVIAVLLAACAGCAGVSSLTARLSSDRRWVATRRHRLAVIAVIAAAAAAAVIGIPRLVSESGDLVAHSGYTPGAGNPAARLVSPSDTRSAVWSSALDAFASDPIKGIGAGAFELWHLRSDPVEEVSDAHSAYLETLGELGIPGFCLLAAALATMLIGLVRAHRTRSRSGDLAATAGLLCAFCVWLLSLAFDWTWEVPAVACLGLGSAAVGTAALAAPLGAGAQRRARSAGRRRAVGPRVAVVALAVAAGIVQIPGLVSEDRKRAAEFQTALGDFERAEDYASEAIAAQPWAASAYALRAVVRLRAGDREGAREDAEDALRREPTNLRLRRLLGRINAGEP